MKVLAAACAGLALWGAIAAHAAADVKVRYYKGEPTLISVQPGSVVQIVVPKSSRAKRAAIGLVAFNRNGKPYSLGYENVTIRTLAGEPVKMLTYDDLERKARNKANWAIFFAAVAAGANSYAAQQSAYGNYYGSAYTRTPYGSVSTTYSASYYNPVAAQIGQARANAENRELFETISGRLDQQLAQLDGTVLRTTTIDPGQTFGGAVVFDMPRGTTVARLILTVSYAGDSHEFILGNDLTRLEQASRLDIDAQLSPAAAPSAAQDLSAPEVQRSAPQVAGRIDAASTVKASSSSTPPRPMGCGGLRTPANPWALKC